VGLSHRNVRRRALGGRGNPGYFVPMLIDSEDEHRWWQDHDGRYSLNAAEYAAAMARAGPAEPWTVFSSI
jgi:hypothetical protein